jgi:DNA-binding beta-propeller fold protein YncE
MKNLNLFKFDFLAIFAGCLSLIVGSPAVAQTAHFGSFETIVVPSGLRTNHNVAVDTYGNVYVPNTWNHTVLKETPNGNGYTATTIGSGWQEPWGITIDAAGDLFITDTGLNTVVKLTPSGSTYKQSTIAKGFNSPQGLAVDASGNLYVADGNNNQVVILSYSAGAYTASMVITGFADPGGVAVDSLGNLFIADTNNYRVVKETLNAGTYTQSQVTVPGLDMPFGVAVDQYNNLYVADTYHNKILMATLTTKGTYVWNAIPTSQLYYPDGMAIDKYGDVFIADDDNSRVIEETLSDANFGALNIGTPSTSQMLSFVFDTSGTLGGVSVLTQGTAKLDFINAGSGTCLPGTKYSAGSTCTVNVSFMPRFSGARYGSVVLTNTSGAPIATAYLSGIGEGPQVSFSPGTESVINSGANLSANGPAFDQLGNIYYADFNYNEVVVMTPGANGYTSSIFRSGLNQPSAVAIDGAGNLYIADSKNSRVLKETLTASGYVESTLPTVNLSYPTGLAVDAGGNVYMTDTTNNRVVILAYNNGKYTQTTVGTGLHYPYGLAVDLVGNIYIADTLNSRVVKETATGNGYVQSTIETNVVDPYEVAVDGNGNVYVADTFNRRIVKETPTTNGYVQSKVPTRSLGQTYGIGVDQAGNLYIGDGINHIFLKEDVADMPVLTFPATAVGSTSSMQTMMVVNNGNQPLTIESLTSSANPSVSPNYMLDNTNNNDCAVVPAGGSTENLAAGAFCLLGVTFTPTGNGSTNGSITLVSNNLNAPAPNYATQSIGLAGSLLFDPAVTMSLSATEVTYPALVNDTICVASAVKNTTATGTVQIFDGSTALTTLKLASNGCAFWTTPVLNAGAHSLTANYSGDSNNPSGISQAYILTVDPDDATITFGALVWTYTGSPIAVPVYTNPTNLSVSITYTQNGVVVAAPTNVGTYTVTVVSTNPNYSETGTATLTIKQAPTSITLGSLTQTYTGSAIAPAIYTNPSNLAVTATYTQNGVAVTPIHAGSYTVTVVPTNPNYSGSATGTLTIKPFQASISLGSLTQTYTGKAISAAVYTNPSNMAVTVTYTQNGVQVTPIAVGSYTVTAVPTSSDYTASATGTLSITAAK